MRVINTFMFVLVAGILSSATSSEYEPNQPRAIDSMSKLDNLVSGDEQSKVVLKLLKESCEKNDGPKAFNTAKKGLQLFLNCSAQSEVSKMPHTSKDSGSLMKEHCAKREITKILLNLIELSVKFICDDNGVRIEKFVADGGEKCARSRQQALQNCMSEVFTDCEFGSVSSFDEQSVEGIQQGLRDLLPTANDCISIEKLQRCSVKVLDECEHHTPADIVNSLLNSIRKALDCKRLIESQVSPANAVNVVLPTALMAISLRFV